MKYGTEFQRKSIRLVNRKFERHSLRYSKLFSSNANCSSESNMPISLQLNLSSQSTLICAYWDSLFGQEKRLFLTDVKFVVCALYSFLVFFIDFDWYKFE